MRFEQGFCRATLLVMLSGCFPEVSYDAGKLGLVGDTDSLSDGGGSGDGGSGDGGSGDGGTGDGGSGGSGDGGSVDGGSGDGDALCSRYLDADSDGFGVGDPTEVACDAPGYSDVDGDCNDASAEVFPGAPEQCNGVDDDCDAVVDNDLQYDWYADADSDGFGAGPSLNTCAPPSGAVANADDCVDDDPAIHPDAPEVCNDVDDDCDSLVDDADDNLDLTSAIAWYVDGDKDGFGVGASMVQACVVPGDDYIQTAGDCDDANDAVNPIATEVCDGIDNDCDLTVDDADLTLDLSTRTTFFTDADSDGYGDPAAPVDACVLSSGLVVDSSDCDDSTALVSPGVQEVCNSIDDDCDGLVDDADDSIDASAGGTYYRDADSDGYGDLSTAQAFCVLPSGYSTLFTDCDDTESAVNPTATEVCDGVDNNCDTQVDDDDPSLDLSTATDWYYDADSDGYGDPSLSIRQCAGPSGYVANGDDCDDTSFDDLDGDGIQDCADDDVDGDGLRGDWDVDDLDDSLVRGPMGGWGGDGALSISSGVTEVYSDFTRLSASASAGASSVSVSDATLFAEGDEILIWDAQGTSAGTYGFYFVAGVSGSTVNVEPPLTTAFSSSDVVIVARVPHYTTVDIAGTLAADPWDGSNGGLVVFRATGAVAISGRVDAEAAGYLGGAGIVGNGSNPTTGGSYRLGPQASSYYGTANNGGGGSVYAMSDTAACGGGGGYGSKGGEGDWAWGSVSASDGDTYGSSTLTQWFFGSGGGGGQPDSGSDGASTSNSSGDGGQGGGLIALYSSTSIVLSGVITADGEDGADASASSSNWRNQGELGGGGGGAGGQILLASPTVTVSGSVVARGGDGGKWAVNWYGNSYGGDGGNGRTRVESNAFTGTSSVSPSASTASYVE